MDALFKDRRDAGRQLAENLASYKNKNAVILAIPRGGIETGYEIAILLNLPLDIVLAKKLPHPHQREFAIGAVSLDEVIVDRKMDYDPDYIKTEVEMIRKVLRQREALYYDQIQPEVLEGRIAIIVDDGIATGNTLMASIQVVRNKNPAKIIVAVPVAPAGMAIKFASSPLVDEFVCLHPTDRFWAVGQFYKRFDQVTDLEVLQMLEDSRKILRIS